VALFARYNLAGSLAGRARIARCRPARARRRRVRRAARHRVPLRVAIYGLAALRSPRSTAGSPRAAPAHEVAAPLARSRAVVLRLTALFALDSFGGGFAVKAMLALWLFQRFGTLDPDRGRGVLRRVAARGLLAARIDLARRADRPDPHDGLHAPAANAFLVLAAFMPTAPLAVPCLLCAWRSRRWTCPRASRT
jgi:hypothetical protein